MTPEINDLHNELAAREELLRLNNWSARETSMLTHQRFDSMISAAFVATYIEPRAAFFWLLLRATTTTVDTSNGSENGSMRFFISIESLSRNIVDGKALEGYFMSTSSSGRNSADITASFAR